MLISQSSTFCAMQTLATMYTSVSSATIVTPPEIEVLDVVGMAPLKERDTLCA